MIRFARFVITANDILFGALLPAVVAAVVLLLAAGTLRVRWAGVGLPIALGVAFASAYATLFKWPPGVPVDSIHWFFYSALAAGVLGAVDAIAHPSDQRVSFARSIARALVVLALATVVIWLVARPLFIFEWQPAQGWIWVCGIAMVITIVWASLDRLLARTRGPVSTVFALAFVTAAAAAVVGMSNSQSLAQTVGILACATGGAALAGLVSPRLLRSRGVVTVWSILYVGLVASSTHHLLVYNGVTTLNAALLLAAPLLLWVGELLPQSGWWRWAAPVVRVALPLVPAGAALLLAGLAFAEASGGYPDYGY